MSTQTCISGSPNEPPFPVVLVIYGAGKAKINDDQIADLVPHNVLGFEVLMNNILGVNFFENGDEFFGHLGYFDYCILLVFFIMER